MKIGIITHFHKSINYGGVLQAYALTEFLNKNGYNAKQILYNPQIKNVSKAPITFKVFFYKIFSKIEKKLYKKRNREIKKRMQSLFEDFRNSVSHTEKEYRSNDVFETNEMFDVFITGSDQVWNPNWFDENYFLSFTEKDKLKISYAASLGVSSLNKLQKSIYSQYLNNFNSISVREKAAKEILTAIINKEPELSVDPTLLLSADEWDEIAAPQKIKEPYVFLYALGDDEKIRKTAEKFAKSKGLKLVLIPDLLGAYRRKDRKIKAENITDATPNDFISLIKHADYIFTDSFHACVFSLVYKKQFFAFQRVGGVKMGSRIETLTELFECSERFIKDEKTTVEDLVSMPKTDYSKQFNEFIKEKEKSLKYLKESLTEI